MTGQVELLEKGRQNLMFWDVVRISRKIGFTTQDSSLSNKKYFPSKLISNFNHHLNHLIICTVVIAFIDCSRIRCVNRESLNLVLHNLLYFFPLRIKNKENKISVITDKTHELWTLAYV